ncbi:MAG: D-2-hydroxyacid dehydrogenase [Rhodobacteraceae bacterium CG17_big_fil_post_rev_8_21_14_2_50_63_15]|nr:D-2-hydroxyacid dehydrogenase [Roseovarius sp.]PIV78324.1 MAG: D-2-hydroxyacid dehydrogenase [Rhodobacteraceae bacterium CG17_big_fil_post_rev_8_21_14_2_50_63_15]
MTDRPNVLIHTSDPVPMLARLAEVAPDILALGHNSYDDLAPLLSTFRPDVAYSVAFHGRAGFPRDSLLGPDGPRWISVGGSGVDHLTPWDTGRVTVTNAAGVAAAMMAEYIIGAALHFTLDIEGMAADRATRHWTLNRMMTPLRGKTMLIVGLGQTGQAVAARAKAFGLRVIGTRARPQPMENVDEVHGAGALPDLWGRADIVVLSMPLLPQTRGLVNARALVAMKPDAILVDVSRGGVLDGAALVNAMRAGRLRGAALDVFETEPLPSDSPLWGLDNVILSPHCSAVYEDWAMQSFELFLENLARWRAGKSLQNVVDPGRGY